ncbi:hypothetical protein FOZ61_001174, partial [Perkinsus olseni]
SRRLAESVRTDTKAGRSPSTKPSSTTQVPPVCLAELELKQVLDSSDSPDPLAPVSHPRRWNQMPRACRHDAYVDLATAPPERVDSDEQLRHMAQAADSTHPLAGTPGLPDTVLAAVNFLRRVGLQNVKGLRESAIAYWSDRAVVLADEAAKVSASMPDNLRRIAGHLNIPLFKEMLHASHYPDEGLADDLIHGLCLHGSFGPLEGVFRTIPEGKRRPPTESLQELLRDGPRRARSLISRVEREESDFTTELWNSAMKEVDAGSMRGPYSFKEIEELFGDFVASRRFAVAQPSK